MKLKASEVIEIDEAFLNALTMKMEQRNKETQGSGPRLYTTEEVAAIVKKDPGTIRIHIRNYHEGYFDKPCLEAEKHGKSYLITEKALETYIGHKPDPQRP